MRYVAVLFLSLSLTACGAVGAMVVPVALWEGTSLVTTEKTASDHVVSFFSGKDCATPRVERGATYCKEDEPNPSPAVHCYRTLGEVTCYDVPDPYGKGYTEVGNP